METWPSFSAQSGLLSMIWVLSPTRSNSNRQRDTNRQIERGRERETEKQTDKIGREWFVHKSSIYILNKLIDWKAVKLHQNIKICLSRSSSLLKKDVAKLKKSVHRVHDESSLWIAQCTPIVTSTQMPFWPIPKFEWLSVSLVVYLIGLIFFLKTGNINREQ